MHRSGRLRFALSLVAVALVAGCSSAPAATSSAPSAGGAPTPAVGAATGTTATAASPVASAAVASSPAAKPAASPSILASVVPSPSVVAASAPAAATASLKGTCPDNIVVQTNWWPEPDHGILYQLIGPNGTIDPNKNTYSGPIGTSGVTAEIRAGGPAIGFQTVTSQMYQDDNILIGLVSTDEEIGSSATTPTTAILAWYQKNPQIFFWGNPAWDFQTTADIGKANAPVLAFEGAAFLDVLVGKGSLNKSQIDTSYTGDPSRFVAADGNIVSQGFATAEPYIYENEVNGWKKPVKSLLLHNEVPIYQDTLGVRADKLEANRACLTALVPLLQKAAVEYVRNPGPINAMLTDYTARIKGGTQISAAGAADAVQKMTTLGIVANGPDGVFGSYDMARIDSLIADFGPVFQARGKSPKAGLKSSDVATNQFLDRTIKL